MTLTYTIDHKNCLSAISDGWNEFATENSSPNLMSNSIIGSNIFSYFSGLEVKHIYEELFTSIRTDLQARTFSFRCDSPSLRRYMKMTIFCAADEKINFQTQTLKVESRERVNFLDSSETRTDNIITICAWCKRAKTSSGSWVEIEAFLEQTNYFSEMPYASISHGICTECQHMLSESNA